MDIGWVCCVRFLNVVIVKMFLEWLIVGSNFFLLWLFLMVMVNILIYKVLSVLKDFFRNGMFWGLDCFLFVSKIMIFRNLGFIVFNNVFVLLMV